MYFWLIAFILLLGILSSYMVHGKRVFPSLILVAGLVTFFMTLNGSLGPIGQSVLAVLAIVVWGSNVIGEKLKKH